MISFMGYTEQRLIEIIDFWENRKENKPKYRYYIYADTIEDLEKYIIEFKNKKAGIPIKQLMTQAEVIKYYREVCGSSFTAEGWVNLFIAAGMLEIKEDTQIIKLCSYERNDLGVIRIEEWPEGLVLWVGGQIKWQSWK